MEELKFKAWFVSEWIYWTPSECNTWFWDKVFSFNLIVIQYIGRKDKNGKEIYKNDILKTDTGNYVVIYGAPCFDLENYDNGDYYVGGCPSCHDWNKFEIIGNKTENPELLND